jgi:hypothetical protein
MDTPEPSPSPSTLPGSDALPWLADGPAPRLAVARRQVQAIKPVQAPEMVHWWVVALTVLTAASVLFGAHGGSSHSRELLPIVMIAS